MEKAGYFGFQMVRMIYEISGLLACVIYERLTDYAHEIENVVTL